MSRDTPDHMAVTVVGALSDVAVIDRTHNHDPSTDQAFVFYDRAGDFVEFFQRKEPYDVELIDPIFTVYKSKRTREIIGGQLCQLQEVVSRILACAPNFKVEIRGNEISLNALFTACKWTQSGHLSEAMVQVFDEVCEVTKTLDRNVQIREFA